MTRARVLTVLLVALLPLLAVGLVMQRGHARTPTPRAVPQPRPQPPPAPPDLRPASYAKAAAANYKVLSPRQSRRLLAYSENLSACLHDRGIDVGAPRVSRTRIVLTLPRGAERGEVLAEGISCGDSLGGPPPGASQQLRPAANAILIYLPKYCLLDPKVSSGE